MLEVRSNLGSIDGKRVNLEYVFAQLTEWEIPNPTKENVTTHWKKHCEKVDGKTKAKAEAATLAKVDSILERVAAGSVDVESDLDFLWSVGIEAVKDRIAQGMASGVTVDHLMKIAAEKTRRGTNEAQAELLKALGGGIGMAIAGEVKFAGVIPGQEPKVELPPGEPDVIEGEFVDEG